MKTVVRYAKGGTLYVQNGEYTLQPYDKTKAKKCCKHGTTVNGEGSTATITTSEPKDEAVYCVTCLLELLDHEVGRLN